MHIWLYIHIWLHIYMNIYIYDYKLYTIYVRYVCIYIYVCDYKYVCIHIFPYLISKTNCTKVSIQSVDSATFHHLMGLKGQPRLFLRRSRIKTWVRPDIENPPFREPHGFPCHQLSGGSGVLFGASQFFWGHILPTYGLCVGAFRMIYLASHLKPRWA